MAAGATPAPSIREAMSEREEIHPGAAATHEGSLLTGLGRRRAGEVREAGLPLTRCPDRDGVPATLLGCLRRLIPFDRGRVMLVEEGSRLSVRATFDGGKAVPLPPGQRTQIDVISHPVLRDVLALGASVAVPDVAAHAGWNLPGEPAAGASWIGVPLRVDGEVAGLFTASRPEPFDEEHVQIFEEMAAQASLAVENMVLFERTQASKARLQTVARRLVEAQERERRHVARELHDEAGQALASLRFGLRLLEREVAGGVGVTERVAELLRTTDAVIDGLHRLAADLRPPSLDHLGLDAALRQYARSSAATYGLDVRFKARGFSAERLPAIVETALFRVVQEAVTNVVRHARASRVDVLLERRGDRVLAMVEDDGVGFDPDRVPIGEHFGLVGLRERAEALDGSLTVESGPGAGTTVVVEVASADPDSDR
jgi:signal transduction histidine kinase